jgi:hypothetical protein
MLHAIGQEARRAVRLILPLPKFVFSFSLATYRSTMSPNPWIPVFVRYSASFNIRALTSVA